MDKEEAKGKGMVKDKAQKTYFLQEGKNSAWGERIRGQ